MAFWQTSDDVPAAIIQACTQSCSKLDCVLSARIGSSTCAGVSQAYNKAGNKIIRDTNRMDVKVCCRVCWREWEVVTYPQLQSKQISGPPGDRNDGTL